MAAQRSISSFMDRVRSINSAASSPFCLRSATSAEIWFRSAFKLSDCVIAARRVRSSSSKPSNSPAASPPRRPSFSFTSAKFARTNPKSSIRIHFTGLIGLGGPIHTAFLRGDTGWNFCHPGLWRAGRAFSFRQPHPRRGCPSNAALGGRVGSRESLNSPSAIPASHSRDKPCAESNPAGLIPKSPPPLRRLRRRSIVEILVVRLEKSVVDFVQLIPENLLRHFRRMRTRVGPE